MKAVTIKQPWPSLIVHGIKDIENRTWACSKKYIGKRVLIHASAKPDKEPYMIFNDAQSDAIDDYIMNPKWHEDITGRKVIYNWVLANPVLFEKPIPAKGKLSF